MIKKLSKREQKLLWLTLIFVCVFSLYIGVYLPLMDQTENLEKQIEALQLELSKNLKTIKTSEAYERYNAYLEKFRQRESKEQIMSTLLSEVEKIASQLEVSISDIKPNRVKEGDFYNHFSLSLTLDGKLNDITHFLYTLQNDPYLFNVDDLRIERNNRRVSFLRCQLVLGKKLIP